MEWNGGLEHVSLFADIRGRMCENKMWCGRRMVVWEGNIMWKSKT